MVIEKKAVLRDDLMVAYMVVKEVEITVALMVVLSKNQNQDAINHCDCHEDNNNNHQESKISW